MTEKKDELLVYGYVRRQKLSQIPIEIIELFVKWYHDPLFIKFFAVSRAAMMNEEKTKIKSTSDLLNSCYAALTMPSFDNNTIYEYTIGILQGKYVAIGMVDALFVKTNTFFYNLDYNKSKFYVLMSWSGHTKSHKAGHNWGEPNCYGPRFNDNYPTIVKLIYDAYNGTISFYYKDENHGVAYHTRKSPELSYRLAIYLKAGAIVELLGLTTKRAV